MSINTSQVAQCGIELAAVMTGAAVTIGTLIHNPVVMYFDNQGTASVAISTDGGATTWRTFPSGEAVSLDMRSNHGMAANYTFPLGTTFTGTGASGTFSISYVYALTV